MKKLLTLLAVIVGVFSASARDTYKNQKNTKITGIEHKRSGYDVELSNGVEMKFDANGKFIRYDD